MSRELKILTVCILMLSLGCHFTSGLDSGTNSNYENSHSIYINEHIGCIELILPKSFDTTYNWIHRSDCGPNCEIIKHRMQSKNHLVIKESGFFLEEPMIDTLNRVTISHGWISNCENSSIEDPITFHTSFGDNIPDFRKEALILDTIVGNFSLFQFKEVLDTEQNLGCRIIIEANIRICHNTITMTFEKASRKTSIDEKKYLEECLEVINKCKLVHST